MEILGEHDAPALDAIAWYGGNSGVDFDLEDGEDSSDWEEKQHPHTQAGTRKVATRRRNPAGLYDMLGNVWEWCHDGWRHYGSGHASDPIGPTEKDTDRILRGGSWSSPAEYVRAAYRSHEAPSRRHPNCGFRLSRGHGPQQAARRADRQAGLAGGGSGDGRSPNGAGLRLEPGHPVESSKKACLKVQPSATH